jgi:hypothetical protein
MYTFSHVCKKSLSNFVPVSPSALALQFIWYDMFVSRNWAATGGSSTAHIYTTPGGSSTAHIYTTPGGSSTAHIYTTPGGSSTVHIYTQTDSN